MLNGKPAPEQLSESTACWPIRAQCAEFKAIKSYYRIKEIHFKLPLQERRPAKSPTVWTWKLIEYHLPSSEQSDYYNISVKKANLNICHNISNCYRIKVTLRTVRGTVSADGDVSHYHSYHMISHHIIMYHIFPYLSQLIEPYLACNTHSVTYWMQKYYFKQHIKLTKHSSQM